MFTKDLDRLKFVARKKMIILLKQNLDSILKSMKIFESNFRKKQNLITKS